MNNTENSGHYQNVHEARMSGVQSREGVMVSGPFQKQEESIRMFKKLSESRGIKEDSGNIIKILKLAEDLKIDGESFLRIHAGLQSISPEQRNRIRYLYAKELGKVSIKAPKPFLEPEIKRCTTFTYLTGLEHENTLYFAINHRYVLPDFVEYGDYDRAIDTVRNFLDSWAETFFRKKDKSMQLVKASEPSMSTHFGNDCPDAKRYEFELIDNETEEIRYKLIYSKGKIVQSTGNLPLDESVSILKKTGWEA